jgi:hypothetical protein
MDGRELKVNSLSRYSKTSPVYVLEEHGHCEVPAGCGGVVLRWRDPREGLPFAVRLHAGGDECQMYLDGSPPPASRSLVGYGRHVAAFDITGADPAFMVIAFAGFHPPDGMTERTLAPSRPQPVLSAADGSWKYTLTEPADDLWTRSGFDDAAWEPMIERPERRPPADPKRDFDRYRLSKLAEQGAVGLGVTGQGERIWIRKEFELTPPGGE